MTSTFIFLLLATPQLTTGNFLSSLIIPPKMVPIEVRIDFGPAGKLAVQKEILIREGLTPRQALEQIFPVEKGAACCHPAEVKGIDGVSIDPMKNRWWRLKINGTSKNASPHKSHLKAGDVMHWIYFEDKQ